MEDNDFDMLENVLDGFNISITCADRNFFVIDMTNGSDALENVLEELEDVLPSKFTFSTFQYDFMKSDCYRLIVR